MNGKVKWYSVRQGYGFIEGEDGEDVFIHKNDIPFWAIFLTKGDKVSYRKERSLKGVKARNVTML